MDSPTFIRIEAPVTPDVDWLTSATIAQQERAREIAVLKADLAELALRRAKTAERLQMLAHKAAQAAADTRSK